DRLARHGGPRLRPRTLRRHALRQRRPRPLHDLRGREPGSPLKAKGPAGSSAGPFHISPAPVRHPPPGSARSPRVTTGWRRTARHRRIPPARGVGGTQQPAGQHVHSDPRRAEVARRRPRQAEQRGLGGSVVVVGHHRILEQVGADVDHPAEALRRHARRRGLDDVQRAPDHGRELTRHVFPRNIRHLRPRVAVEAVVQRIVDHGADRAAEMRLGLSRHGLDRRPVRHVGLDRDRPLAQFSRQRLGPLAAVAPVDHHPRAALGQGPGLPTYEQPVQGPVPSGATAHHRHAAQGAACVRRHRRRFRHELADHHRPSECAEGGRTGQHRARRSVDPLSAGDFGGRRSPRLPDGPERDGQDERGGDADMTMPRFTVLDALTALTVAGLIAVAIGVQVAARPLGRPQRTDGRHRLHGLHGRDHRRADELVRQAHAGRRAAAGAGDRATGLPAGHRRDQRLHDLDDPRTWRVPNGCIPDHDRRRDEPAVRGHGRLHGPDRAQPHHRRPHPLELQEPPGVGPLQPPRRTADVLAGRGRADRQPR
uniref:Efflux RND transporter permease subunit n=1 Tax=Parastrongyloides trichosuri TaxID=131310 RepID=A0A0N4Z7H9_PARTI